MRKALATSSSERATPGSSLILQAFDDYRSGRMGEITRTAQVG